MKCPDAHSPNVRNQIWLCPASAAQMVVLSSLSWSVRATPPPPPPPLSPPLGPSRCLARSQSANQIHFICNQLELLAPKKEISA